MERRGLLIWLLPLLILALAASAFTYMKMTKPERKKPLAKEKVWQVEVQTAEPATLSPHLILYGKVQTQALLRAAAPGAGLVSGVLVNPGERVIQGQKLVTMDSRDFAAANLQASADVADIAAQLAEHDLKYRANQKSVGEEKRLLELAHKEVRRIERLKNNNLSSDSALSDARELMGKQELSLIAKQLEVDRYQTTRQQLEARLERARARLAETELAIERSEVIAPFNGIVADVMVAQGDHVNTSEVLLSLYPSDSLEIRARIPVTYQAEIQAALDRGEKLQAGADLSGQMIGLELVRLAGEADPSGIDAFFRVLDDSGRLRIGNLVSIDLQRPQQDHVVAIPFSAIYGNNRIFLFDQGRMLARDVESVGQTELEPGKNALLIRNRDIQAGDLIILTHLPNAVDGLKVRLESGAADVAEEKAGPGQG